MKRVCVDDVCTSTYRYVPVCTSMYLRYPKFEFFNLDLILEYLLLWSVTLLQFALEELPWCMRNFHVLLIVCTNTYFLKNPVLVCTCMYWYVPVRTGTYDFARSCTGV